MTLSRRLPMRRTPIIPIQNPTLAGTISQLTLDLNSLLDLDLVLAVSGIVAAAQRLQTVAARVGVGAGMVLAVACREEAWEDAADEGSEGGQRGAADGDVHFDAGPDGAVYAVD